MTAKRITIVLVAFCAFTGTAVGLPVAAPNAHAAVSDAPTATTDGSVTLTGSPVAATNSSEATANSSTERVSDCDLLDIDGNDNTVSVNFTSNATDGENSNVSVRIHCGAGNATTIDNDFVDIDGDNNTVTLVVRAENGELLLGGGSGARDTASGFDIASQCADGTLADCDVVDIDGTNNSVNLVVESNGGQTVYEFGSGSRHATAQSDESRSATESVSYYQIDFVTGEPIENLRGEEGTYSNGELIRFAHGSSDQPIMRRSEGEFTTNDTLGDRIESQNITVENGTATTTFTVANGSEPVTLTLASYQKVGPGWSPQTEAKQRFVDNDTEAFNSGTHTLTVTLPDEKRT